MYKPLKRLDGLEEKLDFYQVKEDSLWYSMRGIKDV